jgi:hypothetical protein
MRDRSTNARSDRWLNSIDFYPHEWIISIYKLFNFSISLTSGGSTFSIIGISGEFSDITQIHTTP